VCVPPGASCDGTSSTCCSTATCLIGSCSSISNSDGCGAKSLYCCPPPTNGWCSGPGTLCVNNSKCLACGDLGSECCVGDACPASAGLACEGTKCATCGGDGNICCAGRQCNPGFCCDPNKGHCVGVDQRCSAGTCGPSGRCLDCGDLGEPCCQTGGCFYGFKCNGTVDAGVPGMCTTP
jgi:hypothetical protein